eukprot:COSAG02_NODE_3073_length_7423_cov_10.177635_4_plen_166_part_00
MTGMQSETIVRSVLLRRLRATRSYSARGRRTNPPPLHASRRAHEIKWSARCMCYATLTQELPRPKNSQSDCMQNDRGSQYRIQNSACGHSAPAASDCMQNGRESQYCEFLEFLGRPMNFLGRPINFLGRGSSCVITHAYCIYTAGDRIRAAAGTVRIQRSGRTRL